MPTMPPAVEKKRPENDSQEACHSDGIKPPRVDPITAPTMMIGLEFMFSSSYQKSCHRNSQFFPRVLDMNVFICYFSAAGTSDMSLNVVTLIHHPAIICALSSADQSVWLRTRRSGVRIPQGAPAPVWIRSRPERRVADTARAAGFRRRRASYGSAPGEKESLRAHPGAGSDQKVGGSNLEDPAPDRSDGYCRCRAHLITRQSVMIN